MSSRPALHPRYPSPYPLSPPAAPFCLSSPAFRLPCRVPLLLLPPHAPRVALPGGAAGRFAFVEFRTRELTDAAIQLDKLELCGRQMNIGRPKGYVVSVWRETGWCVLNPEVCYDRTRQQRPTTANVTSSAFFRA